MQPEMIFGPIAVVLFVSAITLPLLYVSYPPRRQRVRIALKGKQHVTLPQACVVTGQQADETHLIRSFWWVPGSFTVQLYELLLPFSKDGWATYNRSFPISLRAFKAFFYSLCQIPLLGAYLAVASTLLIVPVFQITAFVEILVGKRQSAKLHRV